MSLNETVAKNATISRNLTRRVKLTGTQVKRRLKALRDYLIECRSSGNSVVDSEKLSKGITEVDRVLSLLSLQDSLRELKEGTDHA